MPDYEKPNMILPVSLHDARLNHIEIADDTICFVIEAPDGDAMVGSQPLIPSAWQELFAAPLEKIRQIHIVGTVFLFIRKMHIHTHGRTSYLWRLPIR